MTTPIKPMSAEEIVKDFLTRFPHARVITSFEMQTLERSPVESLPIFVTDWLRSALASHLTYVNKQIEAKVGRGTCCALVQSEIDELTK